jgi:CDP-diacylglycerol--serine O-phosphatidyltransferase
MSPWRAWHASNLLTYASLAASVAAIACSGSAQRNQHAVSALIAIAVLADTFDGRFARRFRRTDTQRAIGVQLDSLSDAIAFGIAPAVCMGALRAASWSPASVAIFWMSACAYAACAITRLAFCNVTHEPRPEAEADGFVGLPVPVAALILATALAASTGIAASVTLFITTALAMVLPLPIPRPRGIGLAAFACWPLALIAAFAASS